MAKMLRLEPSGASYRLPADADLEALRQEVRGALDAGHSVEVDVQLDDNPLTSNKLVLTPAIPAFFFIELPEGGSMPVVDFSAEDLDPAE